ESYYVTTNNPRTSKLILKVVSSSVTPEYGNSYTNLEYRQQCCPNIWVFMNNSWKSLYGASGSYAPSYDSTFANLTNERTDLMYQTYGDEIAVQYADFILDFAKDCDDILTVFHDPLVILTGGDYRKTKKFLEGNRRLKEEEEKDKHLLEKHMQYINRNISGLGIEDERGTPSFTDCRLDDTSLELGSLKQVLQERHFAPPLAHLSNAPKPSEAEAEWSTRTKLRRSISTEIEKTLLPSATASVDGLRSAMGITSVGGPVPIELLSPTGQQNRPINIVNTNQPPIQVQISMTHSQTPPSLLSISETSAIPDLESDLREFLENDPT
ncbi:unnamed protein product, partial [Heterotrigona itama]